MYPVSGFFTVCDSLFFALASGDTQVGHFIPGHILQHPQINGSQIHGDFMARLLVMLIASQHKMSMRCGFITMHNQTNQFTIGQLCSAFCDLTENCILFLWRHVINDGLRFCSKCHNARKRQSSILAEPTLLRFFSMPDDFLLEMIRRWACYQNGIFIASIFVHVLRNALCVAHVMLLLAAIGHTIQMLQSHTNRHRHGSILMHRVGVSKGAAPLPTA